MDSPTQTKSAPESRRTVDPLAMALFGVVRDLPASERRVLLSAIDGRLHSVSGERARLALEVLRRCESETHKTVSKRRYERWRESHPERASLPSSTYVSNSLGGSWARAMDAAGITPSVEHSTFRWHRQGRPAGGGARHADQAADRPRYTRWRDSQLADARRQGVWRPVPEWKIIRDRFDSWPKALVAAGLISAETAAQYHRGQGQRVPDEHIAKWLCAAAAELGPNMTGFAYRRWRQRQIDSQTAGYPPSQRVLQLRFGKWSTAVCSADASLTAPRPFDYVLEILKARSSAS